MEQVLEGVTVLDLGRAIAGPFCGMMLGDLGAEVIKIENEKGDESRYWPPFVDGESVHYLSFNRSKKGMLLDIRGEREKGQFIELVRSADVLIENFRVGFMDKHGLGYEELREVNPRLIYCSISGFGDSGPLAEQPATDIFMQSYGGLMSLTGEPDSAPLRVGVSVCDITTGAFATTAVLAALQARERSGRGQYIGSSLLESQFSMLAYHVTAARNLNVYSKRSGSSHPDIVPYQAFEASDGWVVLAAFNDKLFKKSCVVLGLGQMADDPDYATNELRLRNKEELLGAFEVAFKGRTAAHWVKEMKEADVPLSKVNTVEDLLHEPQIGHVPVEISFNHSLIGEVRTQGFPFRLSETPLQVGSPPPSHGEHTEDILAQLTERGREVEE